MQAIFFTDVRTNKIQVWMGNSYYTKDIEDFEFVFSSVKFVKLVELL
jgi:hypothetical protein